MSTDLPLTSPSITVQVAAKINLYLSVGSPNDDGFHPVHTLYQAVSLYDYLHIRPSTAMAVTGAPPYDATNLAYQAFTQLADRLHITYPCYTTHIEKHIPMAGGLAGGSADAAAALVAGASLWNAPAEMLVDIAQSLGSDIPFALAGNCAIGTGRGEHLTTICCPHEFTWVIVASQAQLSTPLVYATLDAIRAENSSSRAENSSSNEQVTHKTLEIPVELLSALQSGNSNALAPLLHNDLQQAALRLMPSLSETLARGKAAGALAGIVSGSGPSCIFLCSNDDHANHIVAQLMRYYDRRLLHIVHGPVPGPTIMSAPAT